VGTVRGGRILRRSRTDFTKGDKYYREQGETNWLAFCKTCAADPAAFATFRRHPATVSMLEHVSPNLGRRFLNFLGEETALGDLPFADFQAGDRIGDPATANYSDELAPDVELADYLFAPTTLRYACLGWQVYHHISSVTAAPSVSILEIGGGYGGQAKILFDLFRASHRDIAAYRIVDLAAVNGLQLRFLEQSLEPDEFARVRCTTFEGLEQDHFDLVVSNYALGEFSRKYQDSYLDYVADHCRHGYIIFNSTPKQRRRAKTPPLHPTFSAATFPDLRVVPEPIETGRHNRLVTW
jgi:hypothetical protein